MTSLPNLPPAPATTARANTKKPSWMEKRDSEQTSTPLSSPKLNPQVIALSARSPGAALGDKREKDVPTSLTDVQGVGVTSDSCDSDSSDQQLSASTPATTPSTSAAPPPPSQPSPSSPPPVPQRMTDPPPIPHSLSSGNLTRDTRTLTSNVSKAALLTSKSSFIVL